MNKSEVIAPNCELTPIFKLFGQKWTILVLREISNGNTHYGSLNKKFKNMSTKTLSNRLKLLENNNIIKRTVLHVTPPIVEYTLTKKGRSSQTIFDTISNWKKTWN